MYQDLKHHTIRNHDLLTLVATNSSDQNEQVGHVELDPPQQNSLHLRIMVFLRIGQFLFA